MVFISITSDPREFELWQRARAALKRWWRGNCSEEECLKRVNEYREFIGLGSHTLTGDKIVNSGGNHGSLLSRQV